MLTSYEHYRLCFRRDVIECLGHEDRFRVISRDGTFEMSRADFERVFGHIIRTVSWQRDGIYHYPRVPEKAEPFRVG